MHVSYHVITGHLHYYGARGFVQDARRAAHYFRLAAEHGDATAISSLAQMHAQGVGVKQNNETALRMFKEAAAQVSNSARWMSAEVRVTL